MSLLMPDPSTLYAISVQQGAMEYNNNQDNSPSSINQNQENAEQAQEQENSQHALNARNIRQRRQWTGDLDTDCYFMNIGIGALYASLVVFYLILTLGKVGESRKWLQQELPVLSDENSKTVVNCVLINGNIQSDTNACITDKSVLESKCSTIEIPRESDIFLLYGNWPEATNSFQEPLDICLIVLTFGGVILVLFKDFFLVFFLFTFTFRVRLPETVSLFWIRLLHVSVIIVALFLIEVMALGIFGFSILSHQKRGNFLEQKSCRLSTKNLPGISDACLYEYWQCNMEEKTYIYLESYWWHVFSTIQISATLILLLIVRVLSRFFSCLAVQPIEEEELHERIQQYLQQGVLQWFVGGNQQQQQNQIAEPLNQEQDHESGQGQTQLEVEMQNASNMEQGQGQGQGHPQHPNQDIPTEYGQGQGQGQGHPQHPIQDIPTEYGQGQGQGQGHPQHPNQDIPTEYGQGQIQGYPSLRQHPNQDIFINQGSQGQGQASTNIFQQQITIQQAPQQLQIEQFQEQFQQQSIASSSRNEGYLEFSGSSQRIQSDFNNNQVQQQQIQNYLEGAQGLGPQNVEENGEQHTLFTFSFFVVWVFRIIIYFWFGVLGYYTCASGIIIMTQNGYHAFIVLGKCMLLGLFLIFSYEP